MPINIEMPKLSDTMTEGTLVKWRKKIGDKVEMGDVLAEIETDKATMEMEAFDDGTLAEILVEEGQKVAVGQKIALLALPGESHEIEAKPAAAAEKPGKGKKNAKIEASKPASTQPVATEPVAPAEPPAAIVPGARVKASPLARRIAAQKGIDLSRITGSGPGGRIIQRDVLEAKPSPAGAAPKPSAQKPAAAPALTGAISVIPPIPAGPNDRSIPLSGMRRVIAERLVASKTTIPHFYLQIEADAGPLLKLRAKLNDGAESEGRGKITVNDIILKATACAIGRVPKVNAAWAGESVIEYAGVHLSVAVAVEDGLVTPVLRNIASKSLREISQAVKDLAARARSKKLKPEEYQGGTFTVSNLGAYGVESFYAIINPPQAAILSVGAIVEKPVVNKAGQIVAGQRITLGLSCDHRVVDGALGSQFLSELRGFIENPALMLL